MIFSCVCRNRYRLNELTGLCVRRRQCPSLVERRAAREQRKQQKLSQKEAKVQARDEQRLQRQQAREERIRLRALRRQQRQQARQG